MRVTQRVQRISGLAVNQYLLIEPEGLTLIDTGQPGNEKKVLRIVQELGKPPSSLQRIFITHADGDHYGALNELKLATEARVYAGQIEADAILAGRSSRELRPRGLAKLLFALIAPLFRVKPSSVDEILVPGQVLPILDGLQVLDSSGHTPGHLSFYASTEKMLFAGDSINISRGRPVPSTGANTWDLERARQSFAMQMALDPVYFCCGHGYLAQKRG